MHEDDSLSFCHLVSAHFPQVHVYSLGAYVPDGQGVQDEAPISNKSCKITIIFQVETPTSCSVQALLTFLRWILP